MFGLAGYESIFLFQRAAFIDLISLVFVFWLCYFNCPDFCLLRLSQSWSAVFPGMRIVINFLHELCEEMVCLFWGHLFFGLDNSELIGCDGSRYALCLSALHL